MSEPEHPSADELTLAERDALIGLLLADLECRERDGAVLGQLRLLENAGTGCGAGRMVARDRLRRYSAALDEAPRGGDRETRLAQARVLFAHGLFFEVHEVLEPAWREATGEPRRHLQGIIQAAVAWHHGAGGRAGPALRAAAAASAKLSDAPPRWNGFPVARLRALLETYRERVGRGESPEPARVSF